MAFSEVISSDMQSCLFSDNLISSSKRKEGTSVHVFSSQNTSGFSKYSGSLDQRFPLAAILNAEKGLEVRLQIRMLCRTINVSICT